MAEPFVFHFIPGPGGHPEVMFIADLWCACGVCGHAQIQRFYHSTPFHPLTLNRLVEIARENTSLASDTCQNCGTDIAKEDVASTVTRYAFADDAGELVCFASDLHAIDGPTLRWQITPNHRLDPQIQPVQHPDEALELLDAIDDATIMTRLARTFSVKQAWRELIAEWREDPDGGAITRASPDCWLAIDSTRQGLTALLDEVCEEEDLDASWYELHLRDDPPIGLVTHAHPERLSGQWRGWMPVHDALEEGSLHAAALLHPDLAQQTITRAFQVARLSYEEHTDEDDGEVSFTDITTPRESAYPGTLTLSSVLARAAYTGTTPGEAARQTAEEIVGTLLRVWKV